MPFTRSLATHLVPRGIRVNAVAPGPVWTPLNPSDKEAKDVRKFGADTPIRRPAQPEEIAPAYVFLASPHCSSYITGEILPIIGGYSGADDNDVEGYRRKKETAPRVAKSGENRRTLLRAHACVRRAADETIS
jgi:hypothetical protein